MNDGEILEKRMLSDPRDVTVRLVYADWLQENGDEVKALELRRMVVKEFGVDFESRGGALTLDPEEVSEGHWQRGEQSRTHTDGWTITGEVHEDYYEWVNDFKASHPVHGRVWGNFESFVFATSEEAFQEFMKNHSPKAWDYGDI